MDKDKIYLNLEDSYLKLPSNFYSKQDPENVPNPRLKLFNKSLAENLGLDINFLNSNAGVEVLAGNKILEGTIPISQAYAGHQFGHFTMLGDGRAILLGEYVTKDKERYDIQLKGAGRTSYSRGGDGKAVLGPMIREYIVSEAMNGLGIPSTRSLAVTATGEAIERQNGIEAGAILTRIAKSHIRVGTFEYANHWCTKEELKELADYTLWRHFANEDYEDNPYLYLLRKVVENQANLIAKWQLVGFIHGVMNTDNITISGETIDYGPCAFMNNYDRSTVFSSIDTYGRYAYGNQPKIGGWNLARFAEALLPIIDDNSDRAIKLAQDAVSSYGKLFDENWYAGMGRKIGISNINQEDRVLIDELLTIMEKYKVDYTNFFLKLTLNDFNEMNIFITDEFKNWNKVWKERLKCENESEADIRKLMQNNNPTIIPRNHIVEEAIYEAVKNDSYEKTNSLLEVLTNPYKYSSINEYYTAVPKDEENTYKTYCGT